MCNSKYTGPIGQPSREPYPKPFPLPMIPAPSTNGEQHPPDKTHSACSKERWTLTSVHPRGS
ncbi:hypothetical protein JAAARDRAFT_314696 [Jaapia argillacea MUCL 33604]|uniref:Uncharacterized protein n=1 Tax=Jaapia argillacea MUCL 33604 TaxID=933084 RepID=A0A067Q025_9AGAM|nr:hypothetical protein JAAARDRAFT_314696 [Jaapia argillacea MUCL 33604]